MTYIFITTNAETDVENCKNIFKWCDPNAQAPSVGGLYQPEGSKRDSERLKDMERSLILLKEKVDASMKMIKGKFLLKGNIPLVFFYHMHVRNWAQFGIF